MRNRFIVAGVLSVRQKMGWLDNPNRHIAEDADNLSYAPSGGMVKLAMLGIILPLVITYYAYDAWTTEKALWFGSRSTMNVSGVAAKWMAVEYFSVGLFCFSRWCLGLLGFYRSFEILTVTSTLSFLVSLAMAIWYVAI